MVVRTGDHWFNDWILTTKASDAYGTPTIRSSSVTYTSESCAEHPSPSRAMFDMFVPTLLMPAMNFDIGDQIRAFVNAQGLSDDGAGSVVDKYVAYFEGEIDGIARRPATGGKAFLTRIESVSLVSPDTECDMRFDPETGIVYLTNVAETTKNLKFSFTMRVPLSSVSSGATHTGSYRGGRLRVQVIRGTQSQFYYPPGYIDLKIGTQPPEWNTIEVPGRTPGSDLSGMISYYNVAPGEEVQVLATAMEVGRGRPSGFDYAITGSDLLARLGRTSIGAEPWNYETVYSRILHIGEAVPGVSIDAYPRRFNTSEAGWPTLVTSNYVRPLDVDHRSALDVYQRTVASLGRVALGLAGRVGMSWGLTPQNNVSVSGGVASLVPDQGYTSEIPSDSIPDIAVALTSDRVATRVSATWYLPGDNVATNPYDTKELIDHVDDPEGIRKYGIIDRKIETDQFTTRTDWRLKDIATSLWSKMEILVAEQAETEWYFSEDPTIIPRDLDRIRGAAELIDNATRFGRAIRLTGPLPLGVAAEHRVKGGKFGFDGGKWRMTLEVEPINFSGVDSATIARAEVRSEFTIGSGTNITISDLRSIAL